MWNTNPPRQVTAADVVRGVKRSCNPTFPFGGQPDFSDILAGYAAFCTGFAKVSSTERGRRRSRYIDSNQHLRRDGRPVSNPLTVDFTLTKPASYFPGVLNLSWANPVPEEILNYLPDSADLPAAHLLGRSVPGPVLRPGQVDRVRPQPGLASSPATRSARPTSTRSTSPRPATSRGSTSRS